MHCRRLAMLLHSPQKLPHPSVAHADLLGRLPLADQPVTGSLQPFQLVSFPLTHRYSLHPSALRLSKGTFYFCQLGTSHFGATLSGSAHWYGRNNCYNLGWWCRDASFAEGK